MTQKAIEVILARQLADNLAMPIFIVDPQGTLIFYNEPAQRLLGVRFEETGEMPAAEWATAFQPMDAQGAPIPPAGLPLIAALEKREPAHRTFWIKALDGELRHLQVTAIPLVGQADRFLGAMAIFWEAPAE
jgi:PAS domain-containing protein